MQLCRVIVELVLGRSSNSLRLGSSFLVCRSRFQLVKQQDPCCKGPTEDRDFSEFSRMLCEVRPFNLQMGPSTANYLGRTCSGFPQYLSG